MIQASRMIAGSRNKLRRKGFTEERLFGAPKLNRTIAIFFFFFKVLFIETLSLF